jgi:integrase
MASVNWRKRGRRYQVYWRLDDGSQGGKTVDTKDEALDLVAEKRLDLKRGPWTRRRRAKLPLAHWDAEWWQVWSIEPGRSPTALAPTEYRRRCYVLPQLGKRPLETITPRVLRQWQNQLGKQVGYESVKACRSIVFRILAFAEDEGAIPANPMRKVPAPERPIDPDDILEAGKRRAYTPEEAGQLLARLPVFWWDHVVCLLGTGLRFGEFAGLHKRRVHLDRPVPVLQVVDTRYQAGKFGSGFKPRPKSRASIREIPLAPQVAEAIGRQLPRGAGPDTLVFAGPGGANGVPRGARTVLDRSGLRRTYRAALAKLADPAAADLRPTAKQILKALRSEGPAAAEELAARFAVNGRALKLATIRAALLELEAAGLATPAHAGDSARGRAAPRWSALPGVRSDILDALDLHGPHDFRHTYSTWLEDAGIPARVIDKLMGHRRSRRSEVEGRSRIGDQYREHLTPQMQARVVAAVEERLAVVLEVAEQASMQRASSFSVPGQGE